MSVIVAGSKYGACRTGQQPGGRGSARPMAPGGRGSARPERTPQLGVPTLRANWAARAFQVIVKQARKRGESIRAFMERELRQGGHLAEYLRREKFQMEEEMRRCARLVADARPNPRSDFRLVAQVPGRLYMRWRQQDKHFWKDDNNLRRLRRDEETARALIKL